MSVVHSAANESPLWFMWNVFSTKLASLLLVELLTGINKLILISPQKITRRNLKMMVFSKKINMCYIIWYWILCAIASICLPWYRVHFVNARCNFSPCIYFSKWKWLLNSFLFLMRGFETSGLCCAIVGSIISCRNDITAILGPKTVLGWSGKMKSILQLYHGHPYDGIQYIQYVCDIKVLWEVIRGNYV